MMNADARRRPGREFKPHQRPKEFKPMPRDPTPRHDQEKRIPTQVNHVVEKEAYVPLNKPLGQIVMEIQEKGLLTEPNLRRFPPDKRNKKSYCIHHNLKGHATDGCKDLREQVEDLVRNGYLNNYIDHGAMAARQRAHGR